MTGGFVPTAMRDFVDFGKAPGRARYNEAAFFGVIVDDENVGPGVRLVHSLCSLKFCWLAVRRPCPLAVLRCSTKECRFEGVRHSSIFQIPGGGRAPLLPTRAKDSTGRSAHASDKGIPLVGSLDG